MKNRIKTVKEFKYEAVFRNGEFAKSNRIDSSVHDNTYVEYSKNGQVIKQGVFHRMDSFQLPQITRLYNYNDQGILAWVYQSDQKSKDFNLPASLEVNIYNELNQLTEKKSFAVHESLTVDEWFSALGADKNTIPPKLLELFASLTSRKSYKYGDNGFKTEISSYGEDNSIVKVETYKYTETGRIIEHKIVDSKQQLIFKTSLKFNDKGDPIEEKIYRTNLIPGLYSKYEYDKNGNVILMKEFGPEGDLEVMIKSKYDNNGYVTEQIENDENGNLNNKTLFIFDKKGYLIEEAKYNQDTKLFWKSMDKYDDNENLLQHKVLTTDEVQEFSWTDYEYNENGFCIRQIEFINEIPQTVIERQVEYYD